MTLVTVNSCFKVTLLLDRHNLYVYACSFVLVVKSLVICGRYQIYIFGTLGSAYFVLDL